jgi:FdhE protein
MSDSLHELAQRNPQWRPWLAEVGALLVELDNADWDAAVPPLDFPDGAGAAPLATRAGLRPQETPIPLLHACRRQWNAILPKAWSHGYCPVCGGWPALAEMCGVERARYLRCVRCGAAWRAHALACPYCANAEHAGLGSLVPQDGPPKWSIEVCRRCRGYLKVLTALRPASAQALLLEDLETLELDLAARERGYRRPEGEGYASHDAA